jgi:hypothetical protein
MVKVVALTISARTFVQLSYQTLSRRTSRRSSMALLPKPRKNDSQAVNGITAVPMALILAPVPAHHACHLHFPPSLLLDVGGVP